MADQDGDSTLASSFTDMMTSLAVIFILLLVGSLNNAQEGSKDVRNEILARLARDLNAFTKIGVKVESDPRDPLAMLVIVPEGLLNFSVDKTDIPADGILFLQRFIPAFVSAIGRTDVKKELGSVVVEGHTDSEGTEEHNLDLSQKRSLAVVLASLDLLRSDPGARSTFLDLVSATGRGKRDLVMQAGKENRDLSRRVVFKVRVRSLEQRSSGEIFGADLNAGR